MRLKVQTQESEHKEAWKDVRLEVLTLKEENVGLKQENRELKARQSRVESIIEAVSEIPEVAAKLKAHAQQAQQ